MVNKRRKDIRGILANPDLRRELMVPTIQATQAREGIDTSREQAERAYYVVTEVERTAFFDLKKFRGAKRGELDRRHEMFTRALADGAPRVRFDVARRDFSSIDGAPLSFRRVGLVSHIFRDAPILEPGWGIAAQGLATADDNRFIRHHWETQADTIGDRKTWAPFAKGGEFCRFYADVGLVVNWTPSAINVMKSKGRVQNVGYYFRPGLTWPLRTQRGFNLRAMPEGCIFGHKGPAIFPSSPKDTYFILGVANSAMAEYLLRGLMSFGSWEVGVIKRLPIPQLKSINKQRIIDHAKIIHDTKSSWDEGNEVSTRFRVPWLINKDIIDANASIPVRLNQIAEYEINAEIRMQQVYSELNDLVYQLYSIPDTTRSIIEETLGDRPSEVLWPQMEGKSVAQKRMEHIFRLLSYATKQAIEADEDGIVLFTPTASEPALLERVHQELQKLFPQHDIGQIEVEIANELKENVKGYRRTNGIGEWIDNAFFEFHCTLYKNRPIFWHIASSQGASRVAFGALCHYHKFDCNRMAKLRALYLKDAIDEFRREAALADRAGHTAGRLEWQARLEEAQELDRHLQLVQEGSHEGAMGGERDYRILTPWKSKDDLPKGWNPDIDDGVKVNIEPLQKAGVLRISKVV
jgi:hypothetical protein